MRPVEVLIYNCNGKRRKIMTIPSTKFEFALIKL